MKNLTPLRRHITYWDSIVNAKKNRIRIHLTGLRNNVNSRYRQYRRLCVPVNLQTIAPSTFTGTDKTYLQSCYDKSQNLSKLKVRIKSAQPSILRGECQYCNIGEPTTFDHYLPKEHFAEFAAFSQNLVPCCPVCNSWKGQIWMKNGHRSTIHYYYDDLPIATYLKCQITYRKGIPTANYTIDQSLIPPGMRGVIDNHYTTLKLLDRYKERSDSEIADVFNEITSTHGMKLSRVEIVDKLIEEASKMQHIKGPNYWRAICKIALANSKKFLDDAGF